MLFFAMKGYPTHCPVCSKSYRDGDEVEVVAENKGQTLVHLTCQECASSMIVSLTFNESGVAGFGMVTDLNREEASKVFFNLSPLSSEEVLQMYSKLRKSHVKVRELLDNDMNVV
jgi:hypothetical protein